VDWARGGEAHHAEAAARHQGVVSGNLRGSFGASPPRAQSPKYLNGSCRQRNVQRKAPKVEV